MAAAGRVRAATTAGGPIDPAFLVVAGSVTPAERVARVPWRLGCFDGRGRS
ncbi:hypothetical protein [Streptosporangium sp. NPDC002721]|uniref:hypothetical protein n=1 Tax=Streptosporangium sp. NPDC002721 TaxID=3366188 RepID=UPI00369595BB